MVKSEARRAGAVSDLAERLRDRIAASGALRFADWMEACLYDEADGYYMQADHPAGPAGDFATAPSLHPFIGQAVAREAEAVWEAMGRPTEFSIAEFGGGSGALAAAARTHWQDTGSELAEAPWVAAEKRPVVGDDESASGLPDDFTGAVVSNEFVDALPFHWLEWRKGSWAEVLVDWDDKAERFVERLGIPRRRAVEAAPKRLVEEGQRIVAMAAARQWLADVSRSMSAGSILTIDYGDRGRDLWTGHRAHGTVRGFRHHELVADVLHDPGRIDITASVDFTQLREWGVALGFVEGRFESQESWLMGHGVLESLAAAPRETVEDASAYLRLKQLVMPQGFGSAFKVQRLDRW